ncbi:S-layer homology domain-containing protein [Paenibacillus oryzisoli]|uniref:S-layer homology domain-containing protein n=1 Tax=Paenibacillus oryzisoli TaxID=1850517 RepID=UPI003D2C2612
MRKSSSNIVQFNLNQKKDIQGGEKKVMKKSLSVVLTTAMALSMFSSVAFGKTSADFTDLKDLDAATKAKFDAMISAGIFDGVSDTTFGLKDEMNRAQFAKVAALLLDLKADATTSSFSDVKADDAANGYALPYIEALKTAGVTDGYGEGTYNPAGKVTKEQLATFLVRVLGKDADGKAKTGNDSTVSDWAQGYVALALELKLLANGEDGKFGGQANATRDLLLTGAYEAKQQYVAPGKVSVTEAKATGAKSVKVTFSKPVDKTKAVVALTKGTAAVTTTAAWAEDAKSVVLTLTDSKVAEGEYTATVSGLDADTVDKTSAKFTGENEKLTKIEFVTAGDTIAKSDKARVQVQPTNQYGEAATFSAGNYTVYATTPSTATLSKTEDGKLFVILDTNYDGVVPNNSQVSINIYDNDQHISATKVFKVGDVPYVTKVELGDVSYRNGKSALSLNGEKAVIALTQYDQYGGVITKETGSAIVPTVFVTPYSDALGSTPAVVVDENNDNVDDVVVTLAANVEKSEEYTVTVFGGGSQSSVKIKAEASKVATKVELVQPSTTIAYGDNDKYVELVAYDEAGNKLSADDIVDNAKAGRFKITASSNLILGAGKDVPNAMLVHSTDASQDYKIVQAGPNKGKIHISKVIAKGQGNLFVAVYGIGVNSNAQLNIPLADVRYPDSIRVATEAKTKAVAGATTKPKFQVFDQYGEKMTAFSTVQDTDGDYTNDANINIVQNSQTVTYDVYTNITKTDGSAFTVTVDGVTVHDKDVLQLGAFSDKEVVINTAGTTASQNIDLKFELRKTKASATGDVKTATLAAGELIDQSVASIARKVTIVTADEAKNLTYSLNAIGDLFNTRDDATYVDTDAQESNVNTSELSKELVVSAKTAGGIDVALPKTITSVTSDIYNVAQVDITGAEPSATAYVIGDKVGTANVTVYFKAADGTAKYVAGQVNVKNEANRVESIVAANTTTTLTTSAADQENVYELMGKVTVKNQYGNDFVSDGSKTAGNDVIKNYDKYLQIRYTLSEINGVTASLDPATNKVSVSGTGSFVITATAPNGKTAMTTVVVKANPTP